MAEQIRIAQLNARRSATVMSEIRKVAEDEKLDLICIQEPYARRGKILGMPVSSQVVVSGDEPWTAVIVFNRDIATTVNKQLSDSHCICLEIKSKKAGDWILGNQYFQFSDNVNIHLQKTKKIIRKYNNTHPILILADLNAKSTLWHSTTTNREGEEVERTLQELNLEVLNEPGNPPTFVGNAETNIDATLGNALALGRISEWKVKENVTTSDHNIILMNIHKQEIRPEEEIEIRRDKYDIRRTNWTKLKDSLRADIRIGEDVNIHESAKQLTMMIRKAMQKAIPKMKENRNVSNKQWSEELTTLRKKVRSQRKRYQRAIIQEEKQQHLIRYRELKAEYTEKIIKTRTDSWDKFVRENMETDMWGTPYKLVSQKIRSPTVYSTLKMDGEEETYTKDWKESAETLLRILLPDDNREGEDEDQERLRRELIEEIPNNNIQTRPFTENEVEDAIMKIKKNRAPGPDGIKVEILQNTTEILVPKLTNLFNTCLKVGKFPNTWKRADVVIIKKGTDKDPEDPKSYRPICLLNVLGKLLERLICNRIQEYRETIGMHEGQYGYRKGKSTEDAINKAMEGIQDTNSRYVVTIFVDISGAFDNMWWPALFRRLRDINCPKDLYKITKNYCQDRHVEFLCPNDRTTKEITKGCPQGSVCGPIFWDLIMEELLDTLHTNNDVKTTVAYADDLLIVVEGTSRREIETKSNNILRDLNQWCKKQKLTVSQKKTTYALMKGTLERDPVIKLDDKSIKRVKTNKYLGVYIDEKQTYETHIEETCKKAKGIMNKLARLAQREYKIPLTTVQTYFNTIMASITSYGASVWAYRLLLVKPKRKIKSVQRSVLIRLTGAFSTTSLDALCVITGICPLDLTIRKTAAKYWLKKGKIQKIEEVLRGNAISKAEINNHVNEEWQNNWDASEVGRRTYDIIPNIQNRLRLPHFKPGRGLVHFLSGHGPYPTYLHRFNLKDDQQCNCGQIGTPEHVVFHCPETENQLEEERSRLQEHTIRAMLNDSELFSVLNRLAEKASAIQYQKYHE